MFSRFFREFLFSANHNEALTRSNNAMEQDYPTLSKEDEKRMQAIVGRFHTNAEELQRKKKKCFQSLRSKSQLKWKKDFSIDVKK